MVYGLISWLVIGVVAGFLASMIVNKKGDGLVLDLVLGVVGSYVGGFIANALNLGGGGLIWTILIATLGAVIVLVIYHAIMGRRTVA